MELSTWFHMPFQVSKLPRHIQLCIVAFVVVHVIGIGCILAFYYLTSKPPQHKKKMT